MYSGEAILTNDTDSLNAQYSCFSWNQSNFVVLVREIGRYAGGILNGATLE